MNGPTPCITGTDKYSLAMDGEENLLQTPVHSFSVALEAWMASCWIYSASYPDELKHTCCFFEKVLLRTGGRVSATARKLVSWSLTSLFSTNMAISETKGQGWKVIRTQ